MNSAVFPVEISACLSTYLDWAADVQYRAVFSSRVIRYWKKHTRFEQKLVDARKVWRCNGKLHCEAGPAIACADGSTAWYLNGDFHRADGPAITCEDGSTEWYLNGKLHRVNGPAITWADGATAWYLNGQLHRVDGPAITFADGSTAWYLNGENDIGTTDLPSQGLMAPLNGGTMGNGTKNPSKNLNV